MTASPAISIIMPAFNASNTIKESISSVQAQTLSDWELIIIDDGSSDETLSVAFEAKAIDDRIRVFQQINSGPSVARNLGIRKSRAPILAFLDSDDLWAQTRLDSMLRALAPRPSVGVLFSRTRFISHDGQKPGTLTRHFDQLSASDLLAENAVCSTSNIVCRQEVFEDCGRFTPGLHHAEDQEWLLRVALSQKWEVCGIDEELFFYRSSPDSQSADLAAMYKGWQLFVMRLGAKFPAQIVEAAHKSYGPFCRALARRAIRAGKPIQALHYLRLGLLHDPLLVLRQPRRTLLTLCGAFAACLPFSTLKELVAR